MPPPSAPGFFFLLPHLLCCCFLCSGGFGAAQPMTLPKSEVAALRQIDAKLNIGWNFSVNPCNSGGDKSWVYMPDVRNETLRYVACGDCNTNGTNLCHVTGILLKTQNLTGQLPEDFAELTHLQEIDLTYNYINGTFPTAWSRLPLVNISVLGNRLTGRIPDEIGNISTLKSLVLEDNLFEGTLPSSLGKLKNLNTLMISGNNFIGELPKSMGNLRNLSTVLMDSTGISGKIPMFIGNWINLNMLYMQGTSMEGPFPSTFTMLKNLTELRVSDLKGGGDFPLLSDTKLLYLTLRNCSISGNIPDYIGNLKLKYLDLSFNKLTGAIPNSFEVLVNTYINFMYLTNNNLTGELPRWIAENNRQKIDVSFNSFTGSPVSSECPRGAVNLFGSYSSSQSNTVDSCFKRNYPCPGKAKNYKLFINCGGKATTVADQEYEDDSSSDGISSFFISKEKNWAYSSTGDFINSKAIHIAGNTSLLKTDNPELYMTARLSPLSLRYYGLCLQNGNYTVKLHFAEIMFTEDHTYSSNGRRWFDVSIQGKKVLPNFNIVEAANGVGRSIVKNFTAVVVDHTLEIHFQWAGKGTMAIPKRGVYGPLISAISVTPDFEPDLEKERKLSIGVILGIVAACGVLVLLLLILLWFFMRRKHLKDNELKCLEMQTGYFSLKQIKTATRNFDEANKIGEGGFGPVFKGTLPDGSAIAVKQLSSKSKQGNREFVNEIGLISGLQHPNLVRLLGCCIEGSQLLLVYEYMENNNLSRALFDSNGTRLKFTWKARCNICLDIARGLEFLHETSALKIVHRDIKATNILLDKDLNAKISDFGLAKLHEEENTHISTRIAGTFGYMAPEYAMRGYLTDKADVYSFGVVMLEIISGKSNAHYKPIEEFTYLLDWAYVLKKKGNLLELVDPRLGSDYPEEQALQLLNLTLECTDPSPTLRPTMSTVVRILESGAPGKALIAVPNAEQDIRIDSYKEISHSYASDFSHRYTSDGVSDDSLPLAFSAISGSGYTVNGIYHS